MSTYGTTDRCTGGTPSTDNALVSNPIANAFDNNIGTSYKSDNVAYPRTVKYDFGAGVLWAIGQIKLTAINGSDSSYMPKDFTIQGSLDNSNWTTLSTQTGQTFSAGETKTYSYTNKIKYRYIKLNITANNQATNYIMIAEIEMFETILPKGGIAIGSPMMY